MDINFEQIDPHKYPGSLEELEKRNRLKGNNNGKDNSRTKIIIFIGLALLIAGGLIAGYFAYKEGSIDKDFFDNPENFVSFIPFWIAIFIPLIITKKKKSEGETPNKKRVLLILVALGVLFAVGFGIFFAASEF